MRAVLLLLLVALLVFATLWWVTDGNIPPPHCVKAAQANIQRADCPRIATP